MKRIEIVSLTLVVAAVVVLIIALQMDYGSHRVWMTLLSFALLMLSLDPKRLKKRKNKMIEEPDETEEDETGFIELASAEPIDKAALNRSDAYLTFQDKLSDVYYHIHYVDGEAYEIYVSEPCWLERFDYDELDENYQTLDDLFETADNEEVDDIYSISAEDFCSVRKRYQDKKVVLSNVCGYFKYNEYGGTFFIKYQNCRLDMLAYVHEDGKIEKFDPKVDSLGDESLSDEIKAFYADLEDFYCWRIREEHRIDADEWPV